MTNHTWNVISATQWGGAAIAAVGGLALSQWLAIGGFLIALAGLFINWVYRRKHFRLEREKFEWQKRQSQ